MATIDVNRHKFSSEIFTQAAVCYPEITLTKLWLKTQSRVAKLACKSVGAMSLMILIGLPLDTVSWKLHKQRMSVSFVCVKIFTKILYFLSSSHWVSL